jgi:hypothetical protein
MSEVGVEIDHDWRTRTIKEAQEQGYTLLRLTCDCGRITYYRFTSLLQRPGITRHTFIGNIPFKCINCGSKEPQIGVWKSVEPELT